MAPQTRKFRDVLHRKLQDPEYALEFLNTALEEYQEDRDLPTFLLCLRDLAAARGFQELAEKMDKDRGSIYRSFSKKGNPAFHTVFDLLNALGFYIPKAELKAS